MAAEKVTFPLSTISYRQTFAKKSSKDAFFKIIFLGYLSLVFITQTFFCCR